MAESGWTQTFAELDAAANRLSRVFRAAGFQPGDHVAMCMENHPRYLEVLWGCESTGLIYTAASSRLTNDELSYIVNDCGREGSSPRSTSRSRLPPSWTRPLNSSCGSWSTARSTATRATSRPSRPRRPRHSPTGSRAPTCSTRRERPAAQGRGMPALCGAADRRSGVTGVGSDAPSLVRRGRRHDVRVPGAAVPRPRCGSACRRIAIGATVVVMDRFDAELYLGLHRPVPGDPQPGRAHHVRPHAQTARRGAGAQYDVSSLRVCHPRRGACPVPVKEQMIDWWGPVMHEYYAGTEGNGFSYCNSEMWLAHKGTVGMPINCVVHIVGDDGDEVPQGEIGTVYFEGGRPRSSTTTIRRRPPDRATRRAGRRWATSATSTRTTTSTSPTARRT